IGSNSARLVIYTREAKGQLRILGSARDGLRLVRDVDRHHRLSEESIATTLRTLREFRSMIRACGARHIIAVATAAMRDAQNGKDLIARARNELGLDIEIIDSDREDGFSHSNIFLLSTILTSAHGDEDGQSAHLPLLKDIEHNDIQRAAILLKI